MFSRTVATATAALVGLAGLSTAAPAGALTEAANGRGTGELAVTLAHYSLAEALDVRLAEMTALATTDAPRHDLAQNQASGEITGVVAEGPGIGTHRFPNPPVAAESKGGRSIDDRGELAARVPPTDHAADATAGAFDLVARLAPGAADTGRAMLSAGSISDGSLHPARVESALDGATAEVVASSQLGSISLLGGLSTFEGAGPGEHRAWTSDGEAGVTAQAARIGSATILDTRAAFALLGVDVDALPTDALIDLASSLGVPPAPASVGSAPLLAVADLSASVSAVASLGPDGTPRTSVATGGGVGAISIAGVEAGGFRLDDSLDQWDGLEAEIHRLLRNVLGLLGPEYRDAIQVRVVPRLVEEATVDGPYVVASAGFALLEIVVEPPVLPAPPGDSEGPGLVDDLLDEVPADVPGGGGLPDAGGVLGAPETARTTIVLGAMEAAAQHTRPGVDPACDPACTDITNLTWSPEGGFGGPAAHRPHVDALPRTGHETQLALVFALLVTARLTHSARARALAAATRPASRKETL